MINNSHFIVKFPEKTDSTQYIKREIIGEVAALTRVSTDLAIVKLQYSWGGGHKLLEGPAATTISPSSPFCSHLPGLSCADVPS